METISLELSDNAMPGGKRTGERIMTSYRGLLCLRSRDKHAPFAKLDFEALWGIVFQASSPPLRERVYLRCNVNLTGKAPRASPLALVQPLIWRTTMRQGAGRRAHYSSLARLVTVGCVWIMLALVGMSSDVTAQASATIVAIEGAATTYQSIDRDGKPVTVRVPSQASADIKGKDPQGNVTATVVALDMTQRRVKVQTSVGQIIVLELSPAALTGMQVGDAFTFTVPTSPR
jgi:hypothetical protein